MGFSGRTVLIFSDNTNFVNGWRRGWSSSKLSNSTMMRLFDVTLKTGIVLKLEYVKLEDNPADGPSRLSFPANSIPLPSNLHPLPPAGTDAVIVL
ncbi:hypothetical protein JCM8547_007403 [Rhodosporidiobolus lusitaniae]